MLQNQVGIILLNPVETLLQKQVEAIIHKAKSTGQNISKLRTHLTLLQSGLELAASHSILQANVRTITTLQHYPMVNNSHANQHNAQRLTEPKLNPHPSKNLAKVKGNLQTTTMENLYQAATKITKPQCKTYKQLDMADDQHEEVSKKVSAEEEIRRGITVMRRVVQGRSRGIILDVYWNNQGQLIEPNGHTLTSFIGALVRNEIPITCDDWRNKELNESKEKIWSEIKRCFNIEEERRGFCMKLAGKLLRGFRTFLSSKFLKDADGNFVDAELPKKYESLISAEEWEAFKSKRQDPVFQRISATNRERASSPAYPYRKGRVGYGRLEQSMLQKEESSETSLPAHVLWKEARVGKSGVPQEEVLHVYQKCEELSQSLSPDDTKGILSRALDVPEYSGRVRGKGFGVTPTSLSIKKGKAPSNRELHARLEAMQAELDALRREREASASTVYRDASDKDSINCTFQPNIPEGISHCQLYLSSPYYRMVGKGKVHNVSGVLLHTRELPVGCLKVSVDIAVEPNAALPYPSDDSDATTVHEAVGSFVAWPTNLICVGNEYM
ncbi:hypothetical protein KIW84_012878 [Lathyrus oleraceus]|uniref:DUF8039 domain-containing protein n=1 Tax=Pisum sativum TaxID=3888 RepID=A0A9D5BIP4_PEA|nr:hypothetical protein KIW84_012878 [Pisum sativum]